MRRLTKRRVIRFFVFGTLALLAAIVVGMFATHQPSTPSVRAAAQAEADRDYRLAVQSLAQEMRDCEAARGTAQAANYPPDCDPGYRPSKADYQAEYYMPPTFVFREQFGLMIVTLAALLAVMAYLVGASYVGAEWSSGAMMNLLLWRPQRLKVLSTKLGALTAGLTALTVLVSAAWTGLFALVADMRGTMDAMTSGAWQSFLLMEVRGLVLVLVAGAVGFGLASIGRHTAMALGTAIGAVIVFQFGLGTLLSLAQVHFVEAYLVPVWATAWMDKSITVTDWQPCDSAINPGCQAGTLTLTWPMAGGLLAALVILVVGAAMWTMRSRDVT
jgi:ABC-type transport system involved in multi-copper enzyme maturation permease subunit